jgi:hypothetical protein
MVSERATVAADSCPCVGGLEEVGVPQQRVREGWRRGLTKGRVSSVTEESTG